MRSPAGLTVFDSEQRASTTQLEPGAQRVAAAGEIANAHRIEQQKSLHVARAAASRAIRTRTTSIHYVTTNLPFLTATFSLGEPW